MICRSLLSISSTGRAASSRVTSIWTLTACQLKMTTPKRFAGQEINPIVYRLLHEPQEQRIAPLDRSHTRIWSHQFYAPIDGWGMDKHYVPYTIQYLRLKRYLEGYFHNQVLFSSPIVLRSMGGNLVRIFVYDPADQKLDYADLERTLEKVFGQFQGPGTSGRSREVNDNKEGRVKVRLDVIPIENPLLNAEILAQYVGRCLAQYISPTAIYDRLAELVDGATPKRAPERGVHGLNIAGFRLRIKGRVRGEDMANKHDFLRGGCPKRDQNALMDFGKHSLLLRSGVIGIKAWVHYQKPHREDETGEPELLHQLGRSLSGRQYYKEAQRTSKYSQSLLDSVSETESMLSFASQPLVVEEPMSAEPDADPVDDLLPLGSLLSLDRDYDPQTVETAFKLRGEEVAEAGLWNVNDAENPLIAEMVMKLKELHQPDYHASSRFLW